jgi:hypothetical protein
LAIGALAIRRLMIREARLNGVHVQQLEIEHLTIGD